MSKRKLIFTYVCLVGIPLVGLIGILRAGQRLIAPLSVGGAWTLAADFSSINHGNCRELLAAISQPYMSVSQSGNVLVFKLNNSRQTALPGSIRDTTVTMGSGTSEGPSDATGDCLDPQAIHLEALVGKEGTQQVLAGTLGISGCAACAVPFRAIREVAPRGGDR